MSDTQWPRFMVFQQAMEGGAVLHNGSVHAPDIEMALLNARDVFSRRPDAVSIWVVPVENILSKTREELAAQGLSMVAGKTQADETNSQPKAEPYCIFGKLSEQAQASLLGELEAASAGAALELAGQTYTDHKVLRWWVFPKAAVVSSQPQDRDAMFAPAREKTYKDQAEYPVVTMMRQLRSRPNPDKK